MLANIYLAYLLSHVIQTNYVGHSSKEVSTTPSSYTVSFTERSHLILRHESKVTFTLVIKSSDVKYAIVIITLIKVGHHGEEKVIVLTSNNITVTKELDKGVYRVIEQFSVAYYGTFNEDDVYVEITTSPE